MNINKEGFSLIEIIIATSIITITVFGVYRLIGENTKTITNSSNYLQVHSLFPLFEECISKLGTGAFPNSEYGFNFGLNLEECNTGSNIVNIDNVNYYLTGIILSRGTKTIEWQLNISSDFTKTITGSYIQK